MVREEELVQKAKEVREALIEMAADEVDATHIEVGQIKAKDDTRKLLTVRVGGANRYVPYAGHDTSEFTVGDYWVIIFDDYGTIRLGWWTSNNAGAGTIPSGPHASTHEDGGADEVSVAALSGLLADDQHVLDAEVLAVAAALAHAARHENGGADEISVAALSGLLADKQDADKLQGRDVEAAAPGAADVLTWNAVAMEWQAQAGGAPGAHKDSHKSGGADAFAAADLHESIIKRLQESGGPTTLLMGAVPDGQYLKRVGAAVVGAAAGDGVDENQYGNNLIRNSPGQIVTDGAEPQWWEDSADATITDEDCVGEGIPDKHERCYKVVTTDDDKYGYQVLTFADEELLDPGITVVSFGCWVYCDDADKASIGIYGLNLGLQESAQHTGGGGWEWLEVENITVNGADASIGLFLQVDTGTAFFTMPMLCVGGTALPWKPRGIKHVVKGGDVRQYDQNNVGDIAWSDTDCTANTDPLAVGLDVMTWIHEPNGTVGSEHYIGPSDVVAGADYFAIYSRVQVINNAMAAGRAYVLCDDTQVIRYKVEEQDADSDVRVILWINGYWMWE